MGACCKIIGFFGVLLLAAGAYVYLNSTDPPVPKIEETWWGLGSPTKEDNSIRPFTINIPDKDIADLRDRLNRALPFQEPLEGVNHNYGINARLLEKIVNYWKTKYNWKDRQQFLNKYPQFQTNIQGLNIHFLHVKPKNVPKGVEVLPLLLVHGWPGSVREFYEIIPFLTTPQKGRNFVFEVIAPSLPGYGFSQATSKPGLVVAQMAQIFVKLMERLKFNKFYLQGGDWGSAIVHNIAILYPDHVVALHSNMCGSNTGLATLKLLIGSYFPSLIYEENEKERNYPFSKVFNYLMLESGYMHLQATKPDTVGVALGDSPVGLAAYILEKFTTWTNPQWKDLPDGGLTKKFTYDQLLDNVMIYWVSRSITTSMRLYSEYFSKSNRDLGIDNLPVEVPTGCARFKNELMYPSKAVLSTRYRKLIHLTHYEDGGHFAAFELPEVVSRDLYDFVEKVRSPSKDEKSEL